MYRYFWSGNWPVLDIVPFYTKECAEEWERAIGVAPRVIMEFVIDGVTRIWHGEEDQQALEAAIRQRFKENPAFVLETLEEYEERSERDIEAIRKFTNVDVKELTNEELAARFSSARQHLSYNRFVDVYDFSCERYLQGVLEEWLEGRVPKESVPEYMALLTRPQRESPVFRERQQFFRILDDMKADETLVTAISEGASSQILQDHPGFLHRLEDHLASYRHIRVVVNADPWTMEDLWEDVRRFVEKGEPYVIEEHRPGDNYDPALVRKANELLEQLDPPEEIRLLIRGIQRTIYLRLLDNNDQGLTTMMLRPLYEEFARRVGIGYRKFKMFTDDELLGFLHRKEKIPQELANARWEITAYCYVNGDIILETGKAARKLLKTVEHEEEEELTEFIGKAASPGKVSGKARVVSDLTQAQALQKGEVLVAPSTSAYFVPVLQRASGVAIEFPGLTNHAAIVSRERGVPCVVGLKGIVRSFRTGDMIEVDGDNGIVRKRA